MKRRLWLVFLVGLVLSILADLALSLVEEGRHGFWWNSLWGFFALFGFIGCVLLVLVSKWLGHYWLQRKDDHYD